MAMTRTRKNLFLGLAFLAPNILGFLALTVIPLVLSLVLAFSNWDLRLHNMFKDNTIRFVGLDNFIRLFNNPDFFRFLGNTLFFMMGIPFGIAGSLLLAVLLSRDLRGGRRKVFWVMLISGVLVASCVILIVIGSGSSAMMILLVGLAGIMLVGGVAGGSTVYRTVFFLPSFTAGVTVYILWLKLYNPNTGPINNLLAGPLSSLSNWIGGGNPWFLSAGAWVCYGLIGLVFIAGLSKLRRMWTDGDLGWSAAIIPVTLLTCPLLLSWFWLGGESPVICLTVAVGAWVLVQLFRCRKGPDFTCAGGNGFGSAAMLALGLMVLEFILLGLATVLANLPQWVAEAGPEGLEPPEWLTMYHWAKPAIMIMGFWMAIGSRNMLLYIAGLSNVPQELYEAAAIDGARPLQRFWNVTWPQLAPTTFFIVIMSVIGGLQGGFEMARTMTQGGPAGATTTLSYFIYTEGFQTGRLGYSSAVAWTLFALVFTVTLINWRFGNRYVND